MSSYVVNHEGVTIEEAPLGTPVTCDTGVKTPPDSVGGLVRENTFENDFEHEIHEESVLPSAPAVRILPGDALNFDESFREAVPMPMMSQSNEGGSHDSTHFDAPFALEHTLPTRRNSAIRMVPTLQPLQPLVSSPQPAQPNPINAEFYDPSAKPPVAADTRPQTQPDGDDPDTDNDDSTGFDDDEDFATSGEYNSKKVMVALEALAPKTTSHCWVVQQDAAGKLDVMTPNTFEDFLEFAKPHFSRDHLRVADDIVLHERHGPRKPTTHQWVDMQGLSETEVRQLGNKLVLHELTIEDMIAEDCPEKLEVFEDLQYQYSIILGQWPDQARASGWRDIRVSCITLAGWFFTIHRHPFVGLDEMLRRVRKDFSKPSLMPVHPTRPMPTRNGDTHRPSAENQHYHDYYPAGKPKSPLAAASPMMAVKRPKRMRGLWLYYSMFDVLVDAMIPRVSNIYEKANEVDELILQLWGAKEAEMDDTTRVMASTRKNINDVRRSVVAKESIIKEHRLYRVPQYRDVLDHVQQMMERLDSARDILAQANSNYLAGVSVQAAIGANSTNEVMKKLSILAVIFVPMTLLTSLFGMNVKVPWQDTDGLLPFYLILASFLIFVIIAIVAYYMMRSHFR
ncbi:putative metal ion transporter C17A12.14 [Diplonema papillatum]|nr:putative metal ion transporter C17A12.14 [Diplonema papillatum]KAJ9465892.1 putative metal ion transporter C17A12.14 [Diplonema papillatum]